MSQPNKNSRRAQPTPAEAGPATEAKPEALETAAGPSQEKERQRLAAMGLVEVPIEGTANCLLALADPKRLATTEQRVEMARRHNAVAHQLPKYVRQQSKPQPENTEMAKKVKGETTQAAATAPAPSSDEANLRAAADSAKAQEKDKLDLAIEAAKARARKKRKAKVAAAQPGKSAGDHLSAEGRARVEREAKGRKATKPEKPAKKAKAAAPAKKAGGGIGGMVCDLLVKKKSNEEILAAVKKDFPKARTSAASIAWYRSKLREEGKLPKA